MISNKATEKIYLFNSLKSAKDQAHEYFDKLWKFNYIERNEAYKHLSVWLGIEEPKAHMSKMDINTCNKVVEWSIMMLNDIRRLDLDFGDPIKHPYYEIIK